MRAVALIYGIGCYLLFFVTFLYLIGFIGGTAVPKSLYSGVGQTTLVHVLVNLGLVLVFGLQHSIMARPGFKEAWARIVPRSVERSTYVLVTSAIFIFMFWQWRPMTEVVWSVDNPVAAAVLWALFVVGWGVVFASTFIIDHFDLFGLKQVWLHWRGRTYEHPRFRVTGFYKYVRHPLMFGFLIAFWAAPTMNTGRLLFAGAMTVYILIAVRIEERDLVRFHGRAYESYRAEVSMLFPLRRTKPRE